MDLLFEKHSKFTLEANLENLGKTFFFDSDAMGYLFLLYNNTALKSFS